MTISDLIHVARSHGARRVVISGMPEDVGSRFHTMALLDDVPEEDFASHLDEAKHKLRQTLLSLNQHSDRNRATWNRFAGPAIE